MNYHVTPVRTAIIKKKTKKTTRYKKHGGSMEKRETLVHYWWDSTVSINWCSYYEKQYMEVLKKIKNRTII